MCGLTGRLQSSICARIHLMAAKPGCNVVMQHICVLPGQSRAEYLADLLKRSDGTSGETFAGMVAYMQAHRPPFLVWENVPDIVEACDGNNIAHLVHTVSAIGYVTAFRVLCSDSYLLPQRRRRCYGICALVDDTGLSNRGAQAMVEGMMQTVESLSFPKPVPIEQFLLKPDDAHVKAELARVQSAKPSATAKDDKTKVWRQHTQAACRKRRLDYDTLALPEQMMESEAMRQLSEREQKGLAFWMRVERDKVTSLDVSPSLFRMARGHSGLFPTLCPGSKVVLIEQKRVLTGLESLTLQGFPPSLLKQYARERSDRSSGGVAPDVLMGDLAGNAYSGTVILAVLLSVILGLTPGHLGRHGQFNGCIGCPDDPDVADLKSDEIIGLCIPP